MATRDYSMTNPAKGVYLIVWAGLLNGDDGSPLTLGDARIDNAEVSGTFGVGGTIILEGKNNASAYSTLIDKQGNVFSKTAASIDNVDINPNLVRPRVTAGDGTTNLSMCLVLRKD